MRKDYVEPDDFEYEPTAHDDGVGAGKSAAKFGCRHGVWGGRAMKIAETTTGFALEKAPQAEGWNRPPVIEPDGEGELLEVSMGPHHPSTHGVFRMDVALDGERVIRLKPVFGYLHRNHEQIAETTSYLAIDAVHRSARLFLFADQ